MLLNIGLADIFKVVAVILLIIALLRTKKKDYEYNDLDKKGVFLNIVLGVIYVPLSLAGVTMVFFADSPGRLTEVQRSLLHTGIYCGISVPLIAIASILTSVIARKWGKSKFSFCIQFLPILVFLFAFALCACATIN